MNGFINTGRKQALCSCRHHPLFLITLTPSRQLQVGECNSDGLIRRNSPSCIRVVSDINLFRFPMGSNTTKYNETTPIEIALRSMGVQVPLVQLLEIPSTCETSADQFESSDSVDDSVFDDKDDWRGSMINGHYRRNHPFLVTRYESQFVRFNNILIRCPRDFTLLRLRRPICSTEKHLTLLGTASKK